VQRVLNYAEEPLPVIFLSGRANVPESVQAMKAGAVDFLMKADGGDLLIETIDRAPARNAGERRLREERRTFVHATPG
jgi:FixJ family two-component response regulator